MSEDIAHNGTIVCIGPKITKVLIISESACGSCGASGFCSAAEARRKEIEVPTDHLANYSVGEEVEVLLKKSMGNRAVWLAYVFPLVVLMILIVSLLRLGAGEIVAALGGVAGIAVYYFIIYLFKDRIARDYVFYIRRKSV